LQKKRQFPATVMSLRFTKMYI